WGHRCTPQGSLALLPLSARRTCGLWPMASDHSSVASAAGTSHVTGGTSVQPGSWPGIVSIQATWDNGTWHMCSGVLLSSQWVLTVAHCFGHLHVGGGDWGHGSDPLGPEAEVRRIQRLLVHQHYVASTARNDIALLELDQPVECSDYIQLGCVPDASLRVSELKSCYIAGWDFATGEFPNNVRSEGTEPGMVLREAKVHLMDTELCNSSRWYAGTIHPRTLCAGYPQGTIDTCQGDSGGPLVCKDNTADYFWLVGMSSWGRGCDRARHPGIYTSTQHFYNWILLQTGLSPAERVGPAPEPVGYIGLTPEHSQRPALASSGTLMPMAFPHQILAQFWNLVQEFPQFLKDKTV
uniref:Acrosin n=1 Tax=Malurus cyaneus samueli TaxID=2593467 RepID=A0A8C5X3Q2_9PASS